MAILRVDSFTGMAEILGFTRQIRYNSATLELSFHAQSVQEAHDILNALSIGTVRGLCAEGTPRAERELVGKALEVETEVDGDKFAENLQKVTEDKPPPPEEKPAPKKTRRRKKADADKADGQVPPKAAPAKRRRGRPPKNANPPTVQDDIETPVEEPPKAADPPPPATEKQAPPETPAGDSQPGNGLPEEMLNPKSLRFLVNYIYENETKEPKEIVDRCTEIKPHVPLLKKIRGDVTDRVLRAMKAMGMIDEGYRLSA